MSRHLNDHKWLLNCVRGTVLHHLKILSPYNFWKLFQITWLRFLIVWLKSKQCIPTCHILKFYIQRKRIKNERLRWWVQLDHSSWSTWGHHHLKRLAGYLFNPDLNNSPLEQRIFFLYNRRPNARLRSDPTQLNSGHDSDTNWKILGTILKD